MSWDVVLLRVKGKARSIEDLEDEVPLGKRKEVLAAILAVFPTAEREGPSTLLFRDGDLSIEFALHGRDPVESVTLEVRGEGDPVTPLMALAAGEGWSVLDVSTSEFIDPERPGENGYGGYRRMVRGVTGRKGSKRSKG